MLWWAQRTLTASWETFVFISKGKKPVQSGWLHFCLPLWRCSHLELDSYTMRHPKPAHGERAPAEAMCRPGSWWGPLWWNLGERWLRLALAKDTVDWFPCCKQGIHNCFILWTILLEQQVWRGFRVRTLLWEGMAGGLRLPNVGTFQECKKLSKATWLQPSPKISCTLLIWLPEHIFYFSCMSGFSLACLSQLELPSPPHNLPTADTETHKHTPLQKGLQLTCPWVVWARSWVLLCILKPTGSEVLKTEGMGEWITQQMTLPLALQLGKH